jgi:hypothetical protein
VSATYISSKKGAAIQKMNLDDWILLFFFNTKRVFSVYLKSKERESNLLLVGDMHSAIKARLLQHVDTDTML